MQKGMPAAAGNKDSASRYGRAPGARQSTTGVYQQGNPADSIGPPAERTMLTGRKQRTLGRTSLLGGGES